MRVHTRQTKANDAATRWRDQYLRAGRWLTIHFRHETCETSEDVYMRLVAATDDAGGEPDPDVIDSIIGNRLWTNAGRCSECDEYGLDWALEVGQEPDYESSTAYLCRDCVGGLMHLLGD